MLVQSLCCASAVACELIITCICTMCANRRLTILVQMEELRSSALSFIAQNFAAVAHLSHDLAGLADSLLSRLAKVWRMVWCCSGQECCSEHVMGPLLLHLI